jgi:hypothetical protein
MKKKSRKARGSALIFALILISVVSVMGASMMFLSQSETWSSMNYRTMSQTRYGAESGLSVAADFIVNNYVAPSATGADKLANYDMSVSPVTSNGQPVVLSSIRNQANYPIGGVEDAFLQAITNPGQVTAGNVPVNYQVTATLLSMGTVKSYGNLITVQMWQLVANGSMRGVRNSREQVTAIMERQVTPATVYAAFATSDGCGALTFSGGGVTNSYDSSLLAVNGAGVATPPATYNTYGGNVGANGNLAENGASTTIFGTFSSPDTGVGNCSGGNVTAWTDNGNATVTGGLVKLPQIVVFPTPVIPPPGAGTLSVNNPQTLAPGDYGDITLNGKGALTLTPGVYNVNSISESGANTSITIGPDPVTNLYGPVVINVTGNNNSTPVDLSGNGVQNPSLNPSDLQINYAGSGTIKVEGNNQSAMVIYAPNANITLTGGSDFFGAAVGATVKNAGGTAIHYDLNLSKDTYIVSNYMLDAFSWTKF